MGGEEEKETRKKKTIRRNRQRMRKRERLQGGEVGEGRGNFGKKQYSVVISEQGRGWSRCKYGISKQKRLFMKYITSK